MLVDDVSQPVAVRPPHHVNLTDLGMLDCAGQLASLIGFQALEASRVVLGKVIVDRPMLPHGWSIDLEAVRKLGQIGIAHARTGIVRHTSETRSSTTPRLGAGGRRGSGVLYAVLNDGRGFIGPLPYGLPG